MTSADMWSSTTECAKVPVSVGKKKKQWGGSSALQIERKRARRRGERKGKERKRKERKRNEMKRTNEVYVLLLLRCARNLCVSSLFSFNLFNIAVVDNSSFSAASCNLTDDTSSSTSFCSSASRARSISEASASSSSLSSSWLLL